MAINFINPPGLSKPPGYSHIAEIRSGRIIYLAGQIATDANGNIVGKGDLEAQADQVFRNIGIALEAVGCGPADIAKVTIYMRDASQLATYRKARDRFFAGVTPPASTLVQISRLAHEDYMIEVEAIVVAS